MRHKTFFKLTAIAALVIGASVANASKITVMTQVSSGGYIPYDISADGSVISGAASLNNATPGQPAYIWRQAQGVTLLGVLPSATYAGGYAISGDGKVIVGASNKGPGGSMVPFRWTQSSGMVEIGTNLAGAEALATNFSGNIVVGMDNNGSFSESFLWAQTSGNTGTITNLPDLPGGLPLLTFPFGISADGTVIVGAASSSDANPNNHETALWTYNPSTNTSTVTGLGFLPGDNWSVAYAVSADGNIITGASRNTSNNNYPRPYRWVRTPGTNTGVMQALDATTYVDWSASVHISPDGSVIAGVKAGGIGSNWSAFIWTEAWGTQDLRSVLVLQGVDMTGWGNLERVNAVTTLPNGTIVLTGFGTKNGQAASFRAELDGTICHNP